MKKQYISPATHTLHIAPMQLMAASISVGLSDDTIIDDPDDVAVKDDDWGDIWE